MAHGGLASSDMGRGIGGCDGVGCGDAAGGLWRQDGEMCGEMEGWALWGT